MRIAIWVATVTSFIALGACDNSLPGGAAPTDAGGDRVTPTLDSGGNDAANGADATCVFDNDASRFGNCLFGP